MLEISYIGAHPTALNHTYIQETGRAGRDGLESIALLYYEKSDISKSSRASDVIKAYCSNTSVCRRKFLMKEFSRNDIECPKISHSCCDICAQHCDCDEEAVHVPPSVFTCPSNNSEHQQKRLRAPSKAQKEIVQSALHEYRNTLCSLDINKPVPLLFGKETISGIPDSLIKKITAKCTNLHNLADIMNLGILSETQADKILSIIKEAIYH